MKLVKTALISGFGATLCAVVTETPFDQAAVIVPLAAALTTSVFFSIDRLVDWLHPESDLVKIFRRECPNCHAIFSLKELTSNDEHVHLRCSRCEEQWLVAPGPAGLQAFHLAPPGDVEYEDQVVGANMTFTPRHVEMSAAPMPETPMKGPD